MPAPAIRNADFPAPALCALIELEDMMDEIRICSPTGGLGGGKVNQAALAEAMKRKPHFLACDAGTTDSGPFSLGSGQSNYPRESIKRDMRIVLSAARTADIPVLIGSAGTAGLDTQVDWFFEIASEIAKEDGHRMKIARVYSEQTLDYLEDMFDAKRIRALDPAPHLDVATIRATEHVVGMMGVEPLQKAIAMGADLVIAGRCSDSALFAAIPIMKGFPEGLAWHVGKVLECGTQVCVKAGKGVIFSRLTHEYFEIEAIGEGISVSPQSVAAHSFYENGDPYIHHESSGAMDLSASTYVETSRGVIRVAGSTFLHAEQYSVKLEGAVKVGYQSVIIGAMRDPYFIRNLDTWTSGVLDLIHSQVADILGLGEGRDYQVFLHQVGRNAILGAIEPSKEMPHEVCLVFEATAATQDVARKICEIARQPLLHFPIPEWSGSITSIAFLHNPVPLDRGAVYRFAYNHVALPRTTDEMFRFQVDEVGAIAINA
jgi:hypothetical protein